MKKRKFNLFLNVAIICLCVCAIAIGVYSAKNATLNVSGSVGFNAHNCDVDVTAKIYGDSAESDSATANASEFGVPRTANHARVVDTKYVRGDDSQKIDIGQFYFCDMTDNDAIAPIYIVLDLTNQSLFNADCNVEASVTVNNTAVDYIKVTKSPEITLKDKNATNDENKGSLTITLKLDQTTSIDPANAPRLNIKLNMYKALPQTDLSTSWKDTGANGLFNANGYTFEDEEQSESIKLTPNNIQHLAFTRDETDTTTYKKVKGLNLAGTSTKENPINVYAKTSKDNSTLYDVVVYSESKIYAPVDSSSMFKDWKYLTTVVFKNFYTNKVDNMSHMFDNCWKLTSLNVSNFDTSNVTNMSYMFYFCVNLTSLDISNFNTSKVTNMSYMFCWCQLLTSLDVSSFDTSNVANMSYMFAGNLSEEISSLTSLDLSNFDTSNVTDMSYMFVYCTSLTSLDLSNFDTSNVTTMESMFNRCTSLTKIYVRTNWDTTKVSSSSSMFSNCTKLVGGAGTTFDSNKTDKTYARIDGSLDANGNALKGYLTDINAKPAV